MVDPPYPWHFWNHLLKLHAKSFNLRRQIGLLVLTDLLQVERTEFRQCLDNFFGVCSSRSRLSVGCTLSMNLDMVDST